jgi:predicted DCC family thiol-disulfide oxidoreductase YuxK
MNDISKLRKILNTTFFTLLILQLFKFIELLVVFTVKGNAAVFIVLLGMIWIFLLFIKKNTLALLSLCLSNFVLIFNFDVVNQHFAFITSLLVIFLLDALLKSMKFDRLDVDRATSIILIGQLSVLYLFAGIWKFNHDYFTGMQMLEHIRAFLIFPDPNNPNPWIYRALSILAIAVEFVLAFQFLFRKIYLLFVQSLGFFFHLSIVLLIGEDLRNSFQLVLFATACLCLYPLCDFRNWQDQKLKVYWDADCSFCAQSINFFKKLDRGMNFDFLSNQRVESLANLPFEKNLIYDTIIVHNELTDEFWTKSRAILFVITNNYFFWFAKPLLYLPFIFKLSDKAYDRVAGKRTCHI